MNFIYGALITIAVLVVLYVAGGWLLSWYLRGLD
jgi:hypothetical protein